MAQKVLFLPKERPKPWPPGLDYSKYCPFHRYPGHDLESCYTLRDVIYDLNDQNRLDWNEIDAHLAGQDQGIYQDPLSDHTASASTSQGAPTKVSMVKHHPSSTITKHYIVQPERDNYSACEPAITRRVKPVTEPEKAKTVIKPEIVSPPPRKSVACVYDDIFNSDYRQYITPWDGVTKIKIAPPKTQAPKVPPNPSAVPPSVARSLSPSSVPLPQT